MARVYLHTREVKTCRHFRQGICFMLFFFWENGKGRAARSSQEDILWPVNLRYHSRLLVWLPTAIISPLLLCISNELQRHRIEICFNDNENNRVDLEVVRESRRRLTSERKLHWAARIRRLERYCCRFDDKLLLAKRYISGFNDNWLTVVEKRCERIIACRSGSSTLLLWSAWGNGLRRKERMKERKERERAVLREPSEEGGKQQHAMMRVVCGPEACRARFVYTSFLSEKKRKIAKAKVWSSDSSAISQSKVFSCIVYMWFSFSLLLHSLVSFAYLLASLSPSSPVSVWLTNFYFTCTAPVSAAVAVAATHFISLYSRYMGYSLHVQMEGRGGQR